MEVTPALVLSMWASGLAVGAAVVVRWRIVGPGFTWLAGGVTLLLGVPAALSADGALGWVGVGGAVLIVLGGRRWGLAVVGGTIAAVAFVTVAIVEGNPVAAVSGALFLGSVTSEMMLGHWFLVDPTLPRWSLRRLAVVGVAAAVLDFVVLALIGLFPWASVDTPVGVGYLVLVVTSTVLMLGVVGALREEGYSGVMSATGLSYLALLTAIGAAVLGRLLFDGPLLG